MALVLENSPFLPLLRHSHCPRLPITTQAGLLPRIKHLAAGYFPIKFSKGFFHRCCELTRNNQINQISPSERWLKCHSGRPFTIGQQTNLKNEWMDMDSKLSLGPWGLHMGKGMTIQFSKQSVMFLYIFYRK